MTASSGSTLSLRFQELRKREGILAKAALVLFLLVGAAIFFVWTRAQVIDLGLKMSEIRRAERQAARDNQLLKLEKSTLRSVARIQQYATTNLGMIHPDPRSIRAIENRSNE